MSKIKPMLASDADLSKIKFPCFVQPKIDGVRGLHLNGGLTGRSLKPHKNIFTTERFLCEMFNGFDGELYLGKVSDKNLCRNTSSYLSRIDATPNIKWILFDYVTNETINLSYRERYDKLELYVYTKLPKVLTIKSDIISIIPNHIVNDIDELLEFETHYLNNGLEGIIIRDPDGLYKQGRSTVREGGLLRVKRFIEEEALVINLVEGEENLNEKKTNELGKTYRTSHKAGKTNNGMIGNFECRLLKDVFDSHSKDCILKKDDIITVGAGALSHSERIRGWEDKNLYIGKIIKFKFFPKGIKDKPRFPTFQSLRNSEDM